MCGNPRPIGAAQPRGSALQYAMQTAPRKINMSKTSSKVGKIAALNANRRQFIAGTSAAFLLGLQKPARAQSVLNLLTWPGHGDQEFVAPFERQYGVKVRVKEYVGGEQMLALLNSSPPRTYDAVLTDREYIPQLKAADKIEELDPFGLPIFGFFPGVCQGAQSLGG